MGSKYFITQYNLMRLFKGLRSRYTISHEPYYKFEIEEFKEEDTTFLLFIKLFLKDPGEMTKHLSKIRIVDAYDQLFPPTPPAYHEDTDCEQLYREYFNFELPDGILGNSERTKVCRDLFRKELRKITPAYGVANTRLEYEQALYNLVEEIKENDFLREQFENDELNIEDLSIESFPVIEKRNSTSSSLSFMEMQVDELYKQFKLEYMTSAKAKGYKRPQAFRMEARSVFRKKYRERLMNLIIDFYLESYNPAIAFEKSVLTTLGFFPCSTCTVEDEIEEAAVMDNIDPIDDCRKRMSEIFELDVCAGTFSLMNTPDDALKTIEDIKEAEQGAYYGLHKFTRQLQVVIKNSAGGWYYADLPVDRNGQNIFTPLYELWIARRKSLSSSINSKGGKEIVLLPVKE